MTEAPGTVRKTLQGKSTTTIQKTLVYDIRGRKASMLDPDMGGALATPKAWTYQYDSAGELVSQTHLVELQHGDQHHAWQR